MSRRSSKGARTPSSSACAATATDALPAAPAPASPDELAALAAIAAGLGDATWRARHAAVTRADALLRRFPSPAAVDELGRLLERAAGDRRVDVRTRTCEALVHLHSPAAERTLARLEGDPHRLVVRAAASAAEARSAREASERARHATASEIAAALGELAHGHPPEVLARLHAAVSGRLAEAALPTVHDVAHLVDAVQDIVAEACTPQGKGTKAQQGQLAEARRLLARIHEVVTFQWELAAAAPRELDRVAVREVVAEAVETAQRRCRRPQVKVEVQPPKHLAVSVPRNSLFRALTNVLVNALQALDGPGRVRVNAELVSPAEVELLIEDDGPGMPQGARRALLTGVAARNTARGFHGWGLVLVHQYVAVHCRGRVDVRDGPGGGTTVLFRLPVERDPEATGE